MRTTTVGFDGTLIRVDKEYDSLGRVTRQSEPYTGTVAQYWTTFTYDILGRVTQTMAPDGGISTAAYSGLTTTYTNALGQTRSETKNGLGELVQVTDHLGGFAQYSYDAQGNLKTLTQGGPAVSNAVTSITYDLMGRKVAMDDPDMGHWSYTYNAFGELISQTTATGDVTTMSYDLLGRMVSRIDTDGGTLTEEANAAWIYDTAPNGLGQLAHEDTMQGTTTLMSRDFAYDAFGRAQSATTQIGSSTYQQSTTYDQYGRVFQQFDAAGDFYGLEYTYNAYGFLEAAFEARDSSSTIKEYYRILSMDKRGNVTELSKGGLTVNRSFDAATGRASTITAFDSLNTTLQNLTLTFDLVGNLKQKIDQNRTLSGTTKNLDETFSYDDLNRLTSVRKNGVTSLSLTYDALGNITNKSDVGSYSYGSRPHAVTSAGGVSYGYDLNGSMISGEGRTLSYTAFNKPDYLAKGSNNITIAYGPNRNRYQRIDNVSGSVTTTHYVGNVEKIFKPGGLVETKRYLDGELIVTTRSDGSSDERYLLKDHLGSTDLITDENAQIVQAMSFDAFGQRRNEIDYTALTTGQITSFDTSITRKGYTGHEGLEPVGLIHMNGRVYDPRLGRFVSADPFIQAPRNTQSLNRYSYVWNNPLNSTDPSGYFSVKDAVVAAVGVVVAAYCAPCAAGFWQAVGAGAAFGAFAGAVQTGTLEGAFRGAVVGAFTGGAAYGINVQYGSGLSFEKVAVSGLSGGVASVLQGGKFGSGFAAAGFSTIAGGSKWLKNRSIPVQAVARVVVGGTVSEISGGKFANGAAYAAFSMAIEGAAAGLTQNKDVPLEGEDAQIREFTEKEKQLNALLADPSQENLDRAAAIAADIYGLDISNTKEFIYQADLGNNLAVAKASCMCVYVSVAAMTNAGHFGSTMTHEVFHINKHFLGRSRLGIAKRYTREWYLNEVEAYNHEISNQWRFGNSIEYQNTLIEHRDGMQIDADNARY